MKYKQRLKRLERRQQSFENLGRDKNGLFVKSSDGAFHKPGSKNK